MPSLGADMEAGTLVEWLVKPGDRVKRGDIVAVVETQKGAIEIEIFETGEIEQILVELDTKVPVGTPLARIRTEIEAQPGAASCPAAGPAPAAAPPAPRRLRADPALTRPPPILAGPGAAGRVRASPAARRLAEMRGVALSTVTGSGPGGAITHADVERRVGEIAAPPERKASARPRSRRHASRDRRRHGAIEAGDPALLSRSIRSTSPDASNGWPARMRRDRPTTAC